jgi:DNA-binding MarR family transcriptional regulator
MSDASVSHVQQRFARFRVEHASGFLLRHAVRLYNAVLQRRLDGLECATGQYPILLFLWEKDGLTEKDLGRKARISQPTLVRTLDRMVAAGLIRRRRSKSDKRAVEVRLTKKARDRQMALIDAGMAVEDHALAGLSTNERAVFNDLLRRVVENLEASGDRHAV